MADLRVPRVTVRYSTSLREKAGGGYELDPGSEFAKVSGWLETAGPRAGEALRKMLQVELIPGKNLRKPGVVGKVGIGEVHLGKEGSPDIELRDIALWIEGSAPEGLSEQQLLNALQGALRVSLRSGQEQIFLHGALELKAPVSGFAPRASRAKAPAVAPKKRWIVEVSRQQWASISVEASSAEEALLLARQGAPEAGWQTDKPRDWTFSEPQQEDAS